MNVYQLTHTEKIGLVWVPDSLPIPRNIWDRVKNGRPICLTKIGIKIIVSYDGTKI
jgi:hypothetical protein